MRFCTVPRDTRKAFAREATEVRASLRRIEMSWRSISSTRRPLLKASIIAKRQIRLALCTFLYHLWAVFWLLFSLASQHHALSSGLVLVDEPPQGSKEHGRLHWYRAR